MIIVAPDPRGFQIFSSAVGTQGIPGPAGSGSTIGVKDEGSLVSAVVERVNFTGAGVSISGSGADVAINVPGGLAVVTPQQFGAVGNGVTDDTAAFQDALDYLEATAPAGAFNGYGDTNGTKGGGKLFVPRGIYKLSAALDIFSTVVIEGEGGFELSASATVLQWAAGTSGLRIQRYNTSGDGTYDAVDHGGGDGSIIRNLWLVGGYSGTEAECHGIMAKARFSAENVQVRSWQGDGFHVVALAGSHGASEGNANCWKITNCVAKQCRNGLYLDGDNTNAGMSLGLDASTNRQWGIFDGSFLSNTHIGFHIDGNGTNPLNMATNGTHIYSCVPGQETWCSTNAPPSGTTSNQGWLYHADGGAGVYGARTWTSGLTWRAGGAICTDNPNAHHVVSGYVEGGQGAAMLEWPTLIMGNGFYGVMKHYGTTSDYDGYLLGGAPGYGGGLVAAGAFQALGNIGVGGRLDIAGGVYGGANGKAQAWADTTNGLQILGKSGSNFDLILLDGSGNQVARIPHGTLDWELVAGMLKLPANKGLIGANSAVPASGAHVVGEVVFNSAPAAGGKVGWVCVTAGTPGTWKPFGAIDA